MLSRDKAVAQHLKSVKQVKGAYTNWAKPEVVLKGPDNLILSCEKTTPRQIPNNIEEIVTHKHDKIHCK